MKAFYGSRFSPNMTRTPDGFLVCHNVPIARTGYQDYYGKELGIQDKYDELIKVYRSPEEVFSQATIASFEGKPVTDEHPSTDVTPDNYNTYLKGIVTNVRSDNENIIADLIIYDPILQSEIEAGKREVSCGYGCEYAPMEDGSYQQRHICGNHVAVVSNGRAGPTVAIKDGKPIKNLERGKTMGKINKSFLTALGFKAFAKDAEPDEIKEAMDAMAEEKEVKDEAPNEAPKKSDMKDAEAGGVEERLAKIEAILSTLVKTDEEVHEKAGLDALEEELEGEEKAKDADGEESVTVPAEQIKDEEPGSEFESKNANDVLKKIVKDMKPVIAAIKDPIARKRATDALIKSIKGQMPQASNTYAGMTGARQKPVNDSAPNNNADFGKTCASRHPHAKNNN